MASNISWCDATFDPWRATANGGARVVAAEAAWRKPVRWNRLAAEGKLPDGSPNPGGHRPRVFCAPLADVFEAWGGPMVGANGIPLSKIDVRPWTVRVRDDEPAVTMGDVRRRLLHLICSTPDLDWLVPTKHPDNALRMMVEAGLYAVENPALPCPQPNLWLGTSAENQAAADQRIPELLKVPVAVRFLSVEPMLGPVDLSRFDPFCWEPIDESIRAHLRAVYGDRLPANSANSKFARIHLVIVGGESGPRARPCDIGWIRSVVRQCQATGVPVFVKQLGAKPFMGVKGFGPAIRDPKGADMAEWPEDLRVRQSPGEA